MNDIEYRRIRDEAEKYAKKILSDAPEGFTMLHLECLKNIIPTEIDNKLSDLKGKIILSQIHPLR